MCTGWPGISGAEHEGIEIMTDPSIDGPFPRLHRRYHLVAAARRKLMEAIAECTEGLTQAETISVVSQACSDEITGRMKYAIRQERHGNTEDAGDEA